MSHLQNILAPDKRRSLVAYRNTLYRADESKILL